ncbi:MAG: hypothetical protein AAF196_14445 [Planctomycetota bacterium]
MVRRAAVLGVILASLTGCGPAELPHQIEAFEGPIRVEVTQQEMTTVLVGHLELSREPFAMRFDESGGSSYRWDDDGLKRLEPTGEVPVAEPDELGRLSMLRQAFEAEPMAGAVRVRDAGHLLVEDGAFRMEVRFGSSALSSNH